MSLSQQILVGLVLGAVAGLFFGELIAPIEIVGDAFIRLLQMTVLPYIMVSLIGGIGRLDYAAARDLALKGGGALLIMWGVALAFVAALPLAFPAWESASFFSTSLLEERPRFDFLELYIPSNPIFSLGHNVVPAVVLFSIAVGVALIGVPEKQGLLRGLHALSEALIRITRFVARLAPIGVFGITAHAAGTVTIDELERLQVYIVVYSLAALYLTFFLLPGLVAALTPVRWRDLIGTTRDCLVTSFATGNLLIVIPILMQEVRAIAEQAASSPEHVAEAAEVILPISYNFPNAGKLLMLSFIPFAAWFVGSPLSFGDYPGFLLAGLFSLFGSKSIAIPFLLDYLRIPADLFHVFLAADVVTNRFRVLLGAMSTVCLALLAAFAIGGQLRVRPLRLLRFATVGVGTTAVLLLGLRLVYAQILSPAPPGARLMQLGLLGDALPAVVREQAPLAPGPPLSGPRIPRLRERGSVRICHFEDIFPFAFVNRRGELVGLDVELAHTLARELDLRLELVQVGREHLGTHLQGGSCDLVMSGVVITTERAREVAFSEPYLDQTLALVVKDHRREELSTWERLREAGSLRIASLPLGYYDEIVQKRLPDAVMGTVDTPEDFVEARAGDFDALILSAEAGAALALVYPDYAVVVPTPDLVRIPTAIAMPRGDPELVEFIDTWLVLKQKDGTLRQLYDYWILGREAEKSRPRWSVLRDVLGWVE